MPKDQQPKGQPLAIDRKAPSASATEPAFIARPEGAPVYHGFAVLEDVNVEGFTLGAITDFEAEPTDAGDAFVIATAAVAVWSGRSARIGTSRRCALSNRIGGVFGLSHSHTQ